MLIAVGCEGRAVSTTTTSAESPAATLDGAAPDAGGDAAPPSTVFPAFAPTVPALVSAGGPVLSAPRVVTVTFDSDPDRAKIEQFSQALGSSSYWKAVTAEYGVGKVIVAPPVHISAMPPRYVQDEAIKAWLKEQIGASGSTWGQPDGATVYAVFYPPGVTIDLDGYVSCDAFAGYHGELDVGGKQVPYAVIPRCESFVTLHGLDVLTAAASHELVEVVTDPFPFSDPAFVGPDADHAIWGAFTGGEAGDLCAFNDGAYYTPSDLPFVVQRSWSNREALAGHDPCAPSAKGEVYFNGVPQLTAKVDLAGTQTLGVTIPVGGHDTIDVALYSDAPTSEPWHIEAHDLSEMTGGPPVLAFAFDRTTGQNGDVLKLRIDVLAIDPQFGGEGFMLTSTLGKQRSYWYGYVAN
jgi:hypothetical protein